MRIEHAARRESSTWYLDAHHVERITLGTDNPKWALYHELGHIRSGVLHDRLILHFNPCHLCLVEEIQATAWAIMVHPGYPERVYMRWLWTYVSNMLMSGAEKQSVMQYIQLRLRETRKTARALNARCKPKLG